MTEQRGVPIDEAEMPAWAQSRFPAAQLHLNRGLQWVLLIYMSTALEASRVSVAQRLHVYTLGKERKEANPSYESLARDLNLSLSTVDVSIDDLEGQGWIVVARRSTHSNLYRLAWPVVDVLGASRDVALCGRPTKKGVLCTRRAGWGTDNPGVGPCKLHPIEPQPLWSNDIRGEANGLQPLESTERDSTPTIGEFDSNHWSRGLQPLEQSTPTIGVEYVESALGSSFRSSSALVLAVGERTVRNACTRDAAPTAQPEDLAARYLIAAIPRYRAAPGWAKKHLADLTAAALDAGLGRDAILRYAHMVIAERTYAEHQHIPELRAALARLGRDVTRGDACPEHGVPECTCAIPDRPWTEHDQAHLEKALAYLAPDDLDTTGTS